MVSMIRGLQVLVITHSKLLEEVINKNQDNNKIDIVEIQGLHVKYNYWLDKMENLENEIRETSIKYNLLIKTVNKDGQTVLIKQDQNRPSIKDLTYQSYHKEQRKSHE
jgi:hypothetical protein